MTFKFLPFLLLAAALLCGCRDCPTAPDADVIGRVEYVVLPEVSFKLKARIDTGAGVSSINAKILEVRPGEKGAEMVAFEIKDGQGNSKVLERKIVEWIEIKGKGTSKVVRRAVVRLDICLAGKIVDGRVSLADRSKFLYPVLIGRNLLKMGDFLINPKKKFTQPPLCK